MNILKKQQRKITGNTETHAKPKSVKNTKSETMMHKQKTRKSTYTGIAHRGQKRAPDPWNWSYSCEQPDVGAEN